MILKTPLKERHSWSECNTSVSSDIQWSVFESTCNMHVPNKFIKTSVITVSVKWINNNGTSKCDYYIHSVLLFLYL